MTDISGIDLKGKHVIIKGSAAHDKDVIDRVFYCKFGFGCNPKALGTKIYGQFITEIEKVQLRREDVLRLATEDELKQANERFRSKIKDERCTCGHLKSLHQGLNGHGACQECDCGQFTWAAWVL